VYGCAALAVAVAGFLLGIPGKGPAFRVRQLSMTFAALVLGTALWGIQSLVQQSLGQASAAQGGPVVVSVLHLAVDLLASFVFLTWIRRRPCPSPPTAALGFTLLVLGVQLSGTLGRQVVDWAGAPLLSATCIAGWSVAAVTTGALRRLEGRRVGAALALLAAGLAGAVTLLTFGAQAAFLQDGEVSVVWPVAGGSASVPLIVSAVALLALLDVRLRRERDLERLVRERTVVLRQQQDVQQATLESLNDLILVSDREGRLIQHNAVMELGRAQDIVGRPAEAWVGEHRVTTPDFSRTLSLQEMPLYRALCGERVRSVLIGLEGQAGRRLMTANASPVRGPDGSPQGAVLAMNDVTELETRRAETVRMAEHHQAVLEAMDEGVVLMTPDGTVLTINRRARELLAVRPGRGNTFEELTGHLEVRNSNGEAIPAPSLSFNRIRAGSDTELETIFQIRHPDSTVVWIRTWTQALHRDGELWGVLHTMMDVTDRKLLREELQRLEQYSPLTGLPNRAHTLQLMERAVTDGAWSVLVIRCATVAELRATDDLEGITPLITASAQRVREVFDHAEVHGQLDEQTLVVLLRGRPDDRPARLQDQAVHAALPVHVQHHVGVYSWTGPQEAQDALRRAESAVEHAVRQGTFMEEYAEEQVQSRRRLRKLERLLHQAVQGGRLTVHYQPIVHLASGELAGAEALARWTDPEVGVVTPDEFIPLAEQLGLIGQVSRFVTREALRVAQDAERTLGRPLRVAVNVSPAELLDRQFLPRVVQLLDCHPDASKFIAFEITESGVVHDLVAAAATLHRLREHGFRVSLDDFGTGYSALSTLQALPIDSVKLDRTFVWGIEQDARQHVLTRSVVELAGRLGMEVVAEGVETVEQARLLQEMGCTYAQGYLFSRPQARPDWGSFVAGRTPASSDLPDHGH